MRTRIRVLIATLIVACMTSSAFAKGPDGRREVETGQPAFRLHRTA